MSTLFEQNNHDILANPHAHLSVLIEMALLSPEQRDWLRGYSGISLHPLLVQPEFANLRGLGPTLVASHRPGIHSLEPLHHVVARETQAGVCGWLISACPPDALARHLSEANHMVAPDGDEYLLRYHAPHVLEALASRDDEWTRAFFSPLVVWRWRTPSPRDDRAAWAGYRGAGHPQPAKLPPLRVDDVLWNVLANGDTEPYAVLHAMQLLTPAPFDTTCPGERLSRVSQLLRKADVHGLSRPTDRLDYVLWSLTSSTPPERLPHGMAALTEASAGGARLRDLLIERN